VAAAGGDVGELAALYVDAIAEAVAGAPAAMAIGVHMCRGNFKGKYLAMMKAIHSKISSL
jgi:methionine synthase II (cobalamin-independent)